MAFGAYSKFLFCAVMTAVIYHISAAPAIAKRNTQTVQLLSDVSGLYIAVSSAYSVCGESDWSGKYMYTQQQPYYNYHEFQELEVV